MRIGVIGGGSFGTALAKLLAELDHDVVMWCHSPDVARMVGEQHENTAYLSGVALPEKLRATASIAEATAQRELLVAVSPSHVMRQVMQEARAHVTGLPYVVSAAKGVEEGTLKRMSEVLGEVLGAEFRDRIAALSGPSFAREVAVGMPTAVTCAAASADTAAVMQSTFRAPTFRVYTSTDLVGVELGGAVKNVIAIAAGVSDGLGFGSSSRAALITRGVAEVARLVAKLGGDPLTVSGLSGVGDMVLTCTGDLSRNRTVGLRIGRGERLEDILGGMKMVAEGVRNSSSICALARRVGVELPIAEQIRLLLHEDKPAYQMVGDLMSRQAKPEFWE
jgi:glycerol-3-phosphate dehydrogenase (NAD(P)+)